MVTVVQMLLRNILVLMKMLAKFYEYVGLAKIIHKAGVVSLVFCGFMPLFSACENKSRQLDHNIVDCQSNNMQSISKIEDDSVLEQSAKAEENQSVSVGSSSSSHSQESSSYDNMRGFDPASEDDMDDNGMSRYMENDDEEGWD
jgi:hypothetical protein